MRPVQRDHRALNRRAWLHGAAAAICGFSAKRALAAPNETPPPRESRDLAREVIPFEKLTPPTQERLWGIVGRPTIYRRMPTQVIGCDPDLYLFFLRNPEVVVNMWQLMGISSLQVKRTGNYTFDAKDNAGTQAKVELVYGTPDTHVFLADGAYEGPLLKRKTPGKVVLVLKSDYTHDPLKRVHVANQLDAFIQLEQAGAEFVAKTLQPVIGKTADHNFRETLTFVSRVSQALERNATGVQRLASRLTLIDPGVRDKFVQVATAVNHRAILRGPESLQEAPVDDLSPPVESQPETLVTERPAPAPSVKTRSR